MPQWALLEQADFWLNVAKCRIDHCNKVYRLHRSSLAATFRTHVLLLHDFSDPVASKRDQHFTLTC